MNKIVEKIIETIVNVSGDNVKGMIKKYKLEKFIDKLEEVTRTEYISKYENEKYFNLLDGFLEGNKFYERLVYSIFSKTSNESIKRQCEIIANKFIEEYPQFEPYNCRIKDVMVQLGDGIYNSFLTSDILDVNNALYICMQDKMSMMFEELSDIKKDIKQILKNQQEHYTFNSEKTKEKVINKDSYKELYEIYANDTISLVEKEIAYIQWINKNQDLKEGLVYIAFNCEKANDLERAKRYFEYILSKYEDEYELYNNLGTIEVKQGLWKNAQEKFEFVLKQDENNINAIYNLAVLAYGCEESSAKALQYIQKAYQIEPNDADVVSFYASIWIEEQPQNCDFAISILNSALEKHPDDFYLKVNLGMAYLFQKRFEEGIILLEELNVKYPNRILCVSVLAMIYAMKGVENANKAIPLFYQAYELTKDDGYLRNIHLLETGQFFDTIIHNNKEFEIYSDDELKYYYMQKSDLNMHI